MKKYRIVCNWPSEVWEVQRKALDNPYLNEWRTAYLCSGKGCDGYNEAKKWLKDNDK